MLESRKRVDHIQTEADGLVTDICGLAPTDHHPRISQSDVYAVNPNGATELALLSDDQFEFPSDEMGAEIAEILNIPWDPADNTPTELTPPSLFN